MDRLAFELMAAAEDAHWWFQARREFIAAALTRINPPEGAHLLDAGCGSGGTLDVLAQFGSVVGFEYDETARAIAAARHVGAVAYGALPGPIPFGTEAFDVIGLFDVLEHLDEPVASLAALRARLRPTGALCLTVPAYQWLWGPHDEHHHHRRRYDAAQLRRHLTDAGFAVEYLSYFNTLLLPLAIAQRLKERVVGYSQAALPGRWVNGLLRAIWLLERAWIPKVVAPAGLSLIAIARPR